MLRLDAEDRLYLSHLACGQSANVLVADSQYQGSLLFQSQEHRIFQA